VPVEDTTNSVTCQVSVLVHMISDTVYTVRKRRIRDLLCVKQMVFVAKLGFRAFEAKCLILDLLSYSEYELLS